MDTNVSLDQLKDLDSLGAEQSPSVSQDTHSGNQEVDSEVWHLKFREFMSKEQCNPIQDLRAISTLCHQWLRPDLHTKEEIMEQLVMEQFMISVPQEVQVLVKENGVKTYKDLVKVLQNHKEPRKWSIVVIDGKSFLLQNSEPETVKAREEPRVGMQEYNCVEGKESLSQGQARPGPRSLPWIEEPSYFEEEEILPESIPEKEDPEYLRRKEIREEPMEDREGGTARKSQDLCSILENAEKIPQEELNMDDVATSCPVLERRDLAKNLDLESPRSFKTEIPGNSPAFQGGLVCTAEPVSSVEPVGQPDDHKPKRKFKFRCTVCSKEFIYKSRLLMHMWSHTGVRPFQCSFCMKGFSQSSDLRVHQLRVHQCIHTWEKPFKCRFCSKAFTHESTLLDHERVHTMEKPFECGECHRYFTSKGNLNVHRRIHTQERPYVCEECGSTFRQKGTLKRHMKIHSSKDLEPSLCPDLSPSPKKD